ncbi:MAG: hypothetical protein WCD70_11165 [Alphaproteobacteria bacterium]
MHHEDDSVRPNGSVKQKNAGSFSAGQPHPIYCPSQSHQPGTAAITGKVLSVDTGYSILGFQFPLL